MGDKALDITVGDDGFHTCKHCQDNVLLSPRVYCDSFSAVYKKKLSMKYIVQASSEGCELFQLFLDRYREELRGEAPPSDYLDQEKTLMILFGLEGGGANDAYITSEGWNDLHGWFGEACTHHGKCSAPNEKNPTDMSSTDDPTANFVTRRAYDLDMASTQNFQLARRWLDFCKQEHSGHCSRRTSVVPTRLVDIGLPDGPPCLKIHETVHSEQVSWCALSYCWGGMQRGTTTMANFPKRRFEIVLSELPKIVQDALTVTRELGFRYLWVDSLCIVQDDSHDWAKEVGKMAEVYMGASVTITACSASNAEQGFLHRRQLDDVLGIRYRPQLLKFRYQCLPPEATGGMTEATRPENMATGWLHVANWGNSTCKHPVEERAWTLQEYLLSRRLLVYCAGRIQWLCDGASADEHDTRIRSAGRTLLPRLPWSHVLQKYTDRASSRSDDRLAALGAVARQFALLQRQGRQLPPSPPASTAELAKDYLAGLWRDDLFNHLGWRTVHVRPLPRAPWRAPSWSWAAVDSGVVAMLPSVYEDGVLPPPPPRLLADEIVPAFVENPFGAVAKAVLRIEAPLLRVRYYYLPEVTAEAGKELKLDGVIVVLRDQSGAADEEGTGEAAGGVLGQGEGSVASGDAALEGDREIVRTCVRPDALDSLPFLTVADAAERREQVAELWLMRLSNSAYLVLVEVGEGVFRRCGALNLNLFLWEAAEPKMRDRAMLQRAMNRVPWRIFDFV